MLKTIGPNVTSQDLNDNFAELLSKVGSTSRLINPNFDLWWRGNSFSLTSQNAYTADRWIAVNFTGTVSRQAFTAGQTAVPNEPTYYLNMTETSALLFSRIEQRIEDVRSFAGKKITISFWAKSAASSPIAMVEVLQNFGSGGSSSVETAFASNIALTSSWQKFSYTITVPSISGKTIGANSYIAIVIAGSWGSAVTYNIDIAQVLDSVGDVALPFQPRDFEDELRKCRRYYRKYGVGVMGAANSTIGVVLHLPFLDMRLSTPSLVLLKTSFDLYDFALNISTTVGTMTLGAGGNGFTINAGGFSGLTQFRPVILNTVDVFALDSEL